MTTPRLPGGRFERWAGKAVLAISVVAFAILAGMQVVSPDKRVLQVAAAAVVVFLAFRATSISALGFVVLLLPFPKSTSYGTTNVAFILLVFLVWIFRVSTKREPPPIRTRLDVPIVCLIMAYCMSFYEVEPENLRVAWSIFLNFLTYVLVFYLAVNIIRTPEHVKRILNMQLLSCVLLCLIALYEQQHPGAVLIPGWITLGATAGMKDNIRVGSTFLDFELFGEYCALNLFIQMFLFTRATSTTRRWVLVGIMLLTFFCLFATITRGAILAFMVGLVYLLWLSRKRLNFVRLVTAVSLGIGLVAGGDFVVSHLPNSGSVLERLFATELDEHGVPDTRSGAWKQSWHNILEKPIFGHGPFFAARRGVEAQYWPHNVYLFYGYIVGFVGLAFFLWILWELWRITRPRVSSLAEGSYVQGAVLLSRVVLFTFMIDQIKIDYLRNPRYSFFVWLLFGMVYAIGHVANEEAKARADGSQPAVPPVPSPRPLPRPVVVSARPAIGRVSAQPAVRRP